MTQNRWASKAAWTAAVALLILVGNTFHLWDMIGVTSDAIQAVLNGVLGVLAAFGIFNNPTNKTGF